jgi:hypothetical protein
MIIRWWKVSTDVETYWGWGRRTTPRIASLFHHDREINDELISLMTSMERILLARVRKEAENVQALREGVDEEGAHDREVGMKSRLQNELETVVAPAVVQGRLSKINVDWGIPIKKQYDDCWKDFRLQRM